MEPVGFVLGLLGSVEQAYRIAQKLQQRHEFYKSNDGDIQSLLTSIHGCEKELHLLRDQLNSKRSVVPESNFDSFQRQLNEVQKYVEDAAASLHEMEASLLTSSSLSKFAKAAGTAAECGRLEERFRKALIALRGINGIMTTASVTEVVVGRTEERLLKEIRALGVSTRPTDDDFFVCHFAVWQNAADVLLHLNSKDDMGTPTTPEARVKNVLTSQSTTSIVVSVYGMPGLGKTCTLRALCTDADIRARFKDGIYVLSLGAEATAETFLNSLCDAVRVSGGCKRAQEMFQEKSVNIVVQKGMEWFDNRQCLFLLDDVWPAGGEGPKFVEHLSRVAASSYGSSMVFSTRDVTLAEHEIVTETVQLCVRRTFGTESRFILLNCGRMQQNYPFSESSELALRSLLEQGGGLPVALSIIGRGARRFIRMFPHDLDKAICAYSNARGTVGQSIVDEEAGAYGALSVAVGTSLRMLDESIAASGNFDTRYSVMELHRGLCVMQKQQWIPLLVLCFLWGESRNITIGLAERLDEVGLIDICFQEIDGIDVKGIRIHDLLHDYAINEAQRENELQLWHSRLLEGFELEYGDAIKKCEGCRSWWTESISDDHYFHRNVIRHLIGSSDVEEAITLATRPEWISRQLQTNGRIWMQRDFELLKSTMNAANPVPDDLEDIVDGLSIVLNSIQLGLRAIIANPPEIFFQISSRLMQSKVTSAFLRRVVDYIVATTPAPRLIPRNACLNMAEVRGGHVIPCRGAVRVLVVEELETGFVGCQDGRMLSFDMISNENVLEWKAHGGYITCLVATRDRGLLVSGSSDQTAKIWDMNNNLELISVCRWTEPVDCLDITPDNLRLIAGSSEGSISIWDVRTGQCLDLIVNSINNGILAIATSPDGKRFASAGKNRKIQVWPLEADHKTMCDENEGSGKEERKCGLRRAFGKIRGKKTRATIEVEAQISPLLTISLEEHSAWLRSMCFTRDGTKLMAGTDDRIIRIWNVARDGEIIRTFEGHSHWIYSVSESKDGKTIFSTSWDGTARAWDIDGGSTSSVRYTTYPGTVQDAKSTHDGTKIVWCARGNIRIKNWASPMTEGELSQSNRHNSGVILTCMTADGTQAVTGSRDGDLKIWDTATGKQVGKTMTSQHGTVNDIAVTLDGRRVISASGDQCLIVWDMGTQEKLSVLAGHTGSIRCVQVSLDGKTAISGSSDNTVRIWNLEKCDGKGRVLEGHSQKLNKLFFTQDETQIVSVSENEILLWDMKEARVMKQVEEEKVGKVLERDLEMKLGVSLRPESKYRLWNKFRSSVSDKVTCEQNGKEIVLATMDARITSLAYSPVTKTICLGLHSGVVCILKVEAGDNSEIIM